MTVPTAAVIYGRAARRLSPEQRLTVFALAPDWTGTLDELVDAAVALVPQR